MRVATAAQLVLYGILTSAKDIVIPAVPKKKSPTSGLIYSHKKIYMVDFKAGQ